MWSHFIHPLLSQNTSKLTPDSSFTRDLGVEAAEADGKRLESGDWVLVVHGEDVLPNLPKLEDNILMLLLLPASSILERCNELEVLD